MKKRGIRILLILLILLALSGAGLWIGLDRSRRETAAKPEKPQVEALRAVLREEELGILEQYPDLRWADLSGSRCYEAMDVFADAHPQIQIRYTLPLGQGECPNDVEEINLAEGEYRKEQLLEALPHLRKLRRLRLWDNSLDAADIAALAAAQPAAELRIDRRLAGMALPADLTELDLSGYTMEQLRPDLKALSGLPALREIRLMDEEGQSPFSVEEAAEIRRAAPGAALRYRFRLFGKTVDCSDESVSFRDTPIGDEGLEQIRLALELMAQGSTLTLDDCGTGNEAMAALREEFRGRVKLVWRVHYGIFSDLTDTRVIHAVADEHGTILNDEMCRVLCYCEDTEYLDLGHDPLTSIEFCRYMPHLKMAILSYNDISDLSPLESCQELYFLEMFCCRRLEDLSPLSACKELRMLNVSFSAVTDITPLYGLDQLELFHAARTDVPWEQIEELAERVPDCRITRAGYDIHEVGWRKIREGEYYPWYQEIREIFGYGDPDSWSHK